jgi:hypothetical protein
MVFPHTRGRFIAGRRQLPGKVAGWIVSGNGTGCCPRLTLWTMMASTRSEYALRLLAEEMRHHDCPTRRFVPEMSRSLLNLAPQQNLWVSRGGAAAPRPSRWVSCAPGGWRQPRT